MYFDLLLAIILEECACACVCVCVRAWRNALLALSCKTGSLAIPGDVTSRLFDGVAAAAPGLPSGNMTDNDLDRSVC